MDKLSYHRHRYPSIVIQHAIWLYFRFALSYRDVEDMLAERGIDVSYETVRRWAVKFGAIIAGIFEATLALGVSGACRFGSATISGKGQLKHTTSTRDLTWYRERRSLKLSKEVSSMASSR
jgi:hypothetical protein